MNQRLLPRLAVLVLLALAGCDENSGSSGTGDLNVSLTDAASPDYNAVYISVHQVEVKASSSDDETGWLVVDTVDKTINLLDLTGGTLEFLGTRNISAGNYNQVRLVLASAPDNQKNLNGDFHPFANYVIETDDTIHELKVPSAYQAGIKLAKEFTIEFRGLTELILDFDTMKSVVKAGQSEQWLLKPVIQVIDTVTLAGIGGSVTDGSNDIAQQAAWVSAQTYDATATDAKDAITFHAGTLTDVIGSYLLNVLASDYSLIAFKEGFAPECTSVTTVTGETIVRNVSLTAATSGTLTVTVRSLSRADDSVTVSARMEGTCGGTDPIFYEVTSQSFAEDGSYPIVLPPGTYTVVAHGDNMTTISEPKVITAESDTTMTVRVTTAP